MSAVPFTIMVEPVADTFTPVLDWVSRRLVDITPAYGALYATFRKIEQRRFDHEGPGWAPLAPSTVAQRERAGIGGEHPILSRKGANEKGRRGGQLRTSLTTRGAKGAVIEPLPDGVFMGTSDPVARYHQEGTSKMPARPIVDLTEADAELFAGVLSEYFYGFRLSGSLGESQVFEADAMAGL